MRQSQRTWHLALATGVTDKTTDKHIYYESVVEIYVADQTYRESLVAIGQGRQDARWDYPFLNSKEQGGRKAPACKG